MLMRMIFPLTTSTPHPYEHELIIASLLFLRMHEIWKKLDQPHYIVYQHSSYIDLSLHSKPNTWPIYRYLHHTCLSIHQQGLALEFLTTNMYYLTTNIYQNISIIYTISIRHEKGKNKGITFIHDRGTEIENQIDILS